jgi:hypothetical protein
MSSESLGDDLGHVAIRNEPAGFETGAYSRAERCAVLDFLTQGVADRDVHHVEVLRKMAALGALSGTGGPGENDEGRVSADARRGSREERSLFVAKHAAHPSVSSCGNFTTNSDVRAARSRGQTWSSPRRSNVRTTTCPARNGDKLRGHSATSCHKGVRSLSHPGTCAGGTTRSTGVRKGTGEGTTPPGPPRRHLRCFVTLCRLASTMLGVRAAGPMAEMRSSACAVRRPWRASTDVTAAS